MSILTKQLDIFNTDPRKVIIGHQANCCAKMGRGIAAVIAERYPEAYSADMAYHWPVKIGAPNLEKLGHFSFANEPSDGRWIVNLYGQLLYGSEGKFTDYNALELALINVKIWMMANLEDAHADFPKILAIPYRMGCNRGGGDWDTVYSILETIFSSSTVELWICKQ